MVFDLSISPENFQWLVDTVLKDLIGSELFVFITDMIYFLNQPNKTLYG